MLARKKPPDYFMGYPNRIWDAAAAAGQLGLGTRKLRRLLFFTGGAGNYPTCLFLTETPKKLVSFSLPSSSRQGVEGEEKETNYEFTDALECGGRRVERKISAGSSEKFSHTFQRFEVEIIFPLKNYYSGLTRNDFQKKFCVWRIPNMSFLSPPLFSLGVVNLLPPLSLLHSVGDELL